MVLVCELARLLLSDGASKGHHGINRILLTSCNTLLAEFKGLFAGASYFAHKLCHHFGLSLKELDL